MLKEYLGYFTGDIFFKVLNLFFFYLFVTKLSTNEYALYGLIIANIAFFSLFARFGLPAALKRFFYDKEYDFGVYIGSVLLSYLAILIFFFMSSYLLFHYVIESYQKLGLSSYDFVNIYYLVLAISAVSFFQDIALSFFNAAKKIKVYNLTRLYQIGGTLFFTLVLYYLFHMQLLNAYLYAMLFQYICIAIFILAYFHKNYTIRYNTHVLKQIAIFGLPLFFHNIAQFFIVHVNKYILIDYADPTAVAQITFINNVTIILESLIFIFNITWLPNFYQFMNEQRYASIKETIKKALWLFMMLFGLYAINSDLIVHLISKGKYDDVSLLATLYAVSVLFTFIYVYYVQYLFFFKKTVMLLPITLTGALVSFFLNYYFIIYLGLLGAVLAYLISKLLIAVLAFWQVRKIFDQTVNISHMLIRIFLTLIIVIIIKLIIFYFEQNNYIYLSYIITFIVSLIMLGLVLKIYGYNKIIIKK